MQVLIADDSPVSRRIVGAQVAQWGYQTVVVQNGADAWHILASPESPRMAILDWQMPGLDGFKVLERIDAVAMPVVVFVTAYDAHAIRAFEVNAIDYVLKPFSDERLLTAVERARMAIVERRHGELGRRLAAFVRDWQGGAMKGSPPDDTGVFRAGANVAPHAGEEGDPVSHSGVAGASSHIGRFAVRANGRVRFVAAADVDWIEADGNYMVLHVGGATHRLRASLAALTDGLDPKQFVRIHRSYLLNIDRIARVELYAKDSRVAILRDGTRLPVSRAGYARLAKLL